MKRFIAASIILHVLLICIALFLIPIKKEKEQKPFVARIITPEEIVREEEKKESKPVLKQEDRRSKNIPNERIHTNEHAAPKVWSAVPSSPSAKKVPVSPRALTRELPSKGGQGGSVPDIGGTKGYAEGKGETNSGKSAVAGRRQPSLREKLFDRDIIGKLSRTKQEGTKEGSAVTFDTSEFKYYGYMQRLREKLEGVWQYPREAASKGIYGDLYVEFTIKKNGKLGAIQLIRTSGYKSLDDAAIKALKDAEPYWPLPEDIKEESLTIKGHFIYTLYGTYYIR